MTTHVRPAEEADLPLLRDLERRAGEAFRAVGMAAVADDEPPPLEVLRRAADAGRAWVAVDEDRRIAGYVLADVVDGCAHVEQVSVEPDQQGRGRGRALLDAVAAWAAATGRPAVSLTTFAEVPWNRPLYEHLGFRVLAEEEIGPELAAVRAREAAEGLDPATRVCMRLDIDR